MPGLPLTGDFELGIYSTRAGWVGIPICDAPAFSTGAAAALAATAWVSYRTFSSDGRRTDFLKMLAWFGALIAVTSVLAYFTSLGKILVDGGSSPIPDVWGPFLSRNNFAQFLELAMPAALWLGLREAEGGVHYMLFATIMLAAGLASASRAGSAILLLEAVAVFWIRRKSPMVRRMALGLACGTILFAAIPGIGHLAGRLTEPDPYQGTEGDRALDCGDDFEPALDRIRIGQHSPRCIPPTPSSIREMRWTTRITTGWNGLRKGGFLMRRCGWRLRSGWCVRRSAAGGGSAYWDASCTGVVDYPALPRGSAYRRGRAFVDRHVGSNRPERSSPSIPLRNCETTNGRIGSGRRDVPDDGRVRSGPVIGTVVAKGAFRLDNATVMGNATLFEGATIEASLRRRRAWRSRAEPGSPWARIRRRDSTAIIAILEKGRGAARKSHGIPLRGARVDHSTGNRQRVGAGRADWRGAG